MVITTRKRGSSRGDTTLTQDGGNIRQQHRVKVHDALLVSAIRWVVKRRGTRITPLLLVVMYPALLVMMWGYQAYNAVTAALDPAAPSWWFIAVLGACLTWLMYLTQRQVDGADRSADNDIRDQQSSQWAWRSMAVPAFGTLWAEFILVLQANDLPIVSLPLITVYIVSAVTLWSFLFASGYVGWTRMSEQMTKDWDLRIKGTALAGSRVIRRRRTVHGEEVDLDVSDMADLPSKLTSAQVKEELAVRHKIPVQRIQMKRNPGDASKVTVTIIHTNPWDTEIQHPLYPTFRAGDKPKTRSIREPIILGADPTETTDAKRWITKVLFTPEGAQHLLVVAATGGGKTNLINNVVEHVTDCYDADVEMIDVTKGIDAATWQWACVAVHTGPEAMESAVMALERHARLIVERSAKRRAAKRKTSVFQPTKEDRAKVLILDEADQLLVESSPHHKRRAQQAVKYILSKGRSEGVQLIIMAQRGTLDYLGKGDVKANSFARIVLGVTQRSEMAWAVGSAWEARGIPDMSEYGEGAKGVFILVEPQAWRAGRACALYDGEIVSAIAMDRVRPEHYDELLTYLHEMADDGEPLSALPGGYWAQVLADSDGELPPLPAQRTAADDTGRVLSILPRASAAWGDRNSTPDDDTDIEPARFVTAGDEPGVSETIAAAKASADKAVAANKAVEDRFADRNTGLLELFHARQQADGAKDPARYLQDVPNAVIAHAVEMARRGAQYGFTRAELQGDVEALQLLNRTKSVRTWQIWLRAMVRAGLLETAGGGNDKRYRQPRRNTAA